MRGIAASNSPIVRFNPASVGGNEKDGSDEYLCCPRNGGGQSRLKSPCSRLPTRPPTSRTALPPTARARRSRRRSLPCRRVRERGSTSWPDGSQPCPAAGPTPQVCRKTTRSCCHGAMEPGHDRKASAAKYHLRRRARRAAVRVGRYAAMAGGVGVPGHQRDPRPRLRIVAREDRSRAARRAPAADVSGRPARRRQEIHADVRRWRR